VIDDVKEVDQYLEWVLDSMDEDEEDKVSGEEKLQVLKQDTQRQQQQAE